LERSKHVPTTKLIFFVIIFAIWVRNATAQGGRYHGRDLEKEFVLGCTNDQLVAKRILLRDKSLAITWESLPLIQFS
jgi:hypothetical protein